MASAILTSKMPRRELVIAAHGADLKDASAGEIARYCILRLIGYEHDKARELALSQRNPVQWTTEDISISVRIPQEWIDAAMIAKPGLTKSQLFRYALMRMTEDEASAFERAYRRIGRPPLVKDEGAMA